MPRNVERDAERELERRRKLLESGLKLFSSKGIETVNLQDIADDAEVGIATLYKYYQNKLNLVNAISAYFWKRIWEGYEQKLGSEVIESYNAYERIEEYFDIIIDLYKTHPEMLRFSGYYKTYINNEKTDMKDNEHLTALAPVSAIFHDLYEKAKVDKSIRTDVDEHVLFTTLNLNMLGTAERYALGIVWAGHEDDSDYTKELLLLKDMMLTWLKNDK